MQSLRATDLLEVWDRGRARHPVDRALVVLAFACPDRGWDELCALPIGERNRLLLTTRANLFGRRLDLVTACPGCGEQLEFDFTLPLESFAAVCAGEVHGPIGEDGTLKVRLPDSRDLAAAAGAAGAEDAQRVLLSRCVLAITVGGQPAQLEPEVLAKAFSELVESHDPLSAILFPVRCAECGQRWSAALDPVDYFWREIGQRVSVIVREVHTLARAYGWTEGEVLRLSPGRRRLYIEQVGA